ncbi:MAG: efflux RND transporter permease subunit, partial [Bacteroidota bacterium]
MRLPGIAIKNFQFTLLVLLMLILNGMFSFFTMSRSEDPHFTSPGAVIFVVWPGASTLEMEEQVVRPMEDALRKIDYIKEVNCSSFESVATVALEYEYGVNFEKKYQEVVQEINAVRPDLPDGITDFKIDAFSPADVNIYQIAFVSDSHAYRDLESYADRLGEEIERSKAVRGVELFGVPEREIKIALDQDKLAQLDIPLTQVLGAIRESNQLIPAGSLQIGGKSFNVISNSRFESIEEIERTVIASAAGQVVFLRDVATVEAGDKESIYYSRFNGKRAVFLTVQQKTGTNNFNLDNEVKPMIERAKSVLPEGMSLELAFDQTQSVEERVNDFFINLFQGMVLVVLV